MVTTRLFSTGSCAAGRFLSERDAASLEGSSRCAVPASLVNKRITQGLIFFLIVGTVGWSCALCLQEKHLHNKGKSLTPNKREPYVGKEKKRAND